MSCVCVCVCAVLSSAPQLPTQSNIVVNPSSTEKIVEKDAPAIVISPGMAPALTTPVTVPTPTPDVPREGQVMAAQLNTLTLTSWLLCAFML